MNYLSCFEESVKKNYDKNALVDQDGMRKLTYRELDERSGRVAAKLIREGVCAGDSVMILMGRKSEYLIAYLGILKMGGVVVPVIEEYPKERIEYICKDSLVKKIIRDDFFEGIDTYEPLKAVELEDEALSLIIYTSGSTGNPKGIEHTVKGFCDAVVRTIPVFEGLEEIVMSGVAALSFIAVMTEYMTVFLLGGCTHMLSDAVRKNVRALEEYYLEQGITVAFISPQMLRLFHCDSPRLQRVFAASERLVNVYSENYEIYNLYGMTEACSTISYFVVDQKYANTPIGKAAKGLEIKILDDNGHEVQQGEIGEICVIGYLARGYRNLDKQTAEAFQVLPDGRTLLHTADCGMMDENGNLIYSNRKDWMVKINGQRVETLEIEVAMQELEEISNAAVKAFVDDYGQTYLAAYYVERSAITPDKIKQSLSDKMPSYMIPRFFKQLEAMPVNVNGKLDRKALPAPDINEYKVEYVAPNDELEQAICDGFEQVLLCGRVGVNDDYIRMGGDSIKVMKLSSILSDTGITPLMILRGRTPGGIARLCRKETGMVMEHQTEWKESYQLTDAQLGVYLDCVSHPDTTMYNIPFVCKLPQMVEIEKFMQSVKTVIQAHKAFHVTVTIKGEAPAMILCEREPEIIRKQVEDFQEEKEAFIRPFDLEQGPLYRLELCEYQKETYFLFDVHHLIFDGTSLTVFLREIAAVYQGKQPTEETLSLFDVSVFEETLKDSQAYKEAQSYFEKIFSDMDVDSSLIPDYTPENPKGSAKQVIISAHETIRSSEVELFAKQADITESTLFMGAFAYTLAKSAGLMECFFCTVNNGRHDDRLMDATGMFVKTLPVYVSIDESFKSGDYLQKLQKEFFETMSHDCISFGEIAAQYKLVPSMTFVYQAEMLNGPTLCDETLYAQAIETKDAQADLNVMVVKNHGGYEVILNYKDEYYKEDTIRNFAAMMLMVIKGMLTGKALRDIVLADYETYQKMDDFNQTSCPYDPNLTIVDLFLQQVSRVPNLPAVVYLDKSYTYAQVDEMTDRIAGYLKTKGIGREDVVSVLIPRCEYMVIASLGVLKAGAAYQPLDPSYPKERIGFMMKDASAKHLIAEESLLELAEGYEGEVLLTKDISSLPVCDKLKETPSPEDLFVLLYTSGSTGVPKGVMLEHRNVAALCHWYHRAYHLQEGDNVALYPSYGFDAHMMDLYPAITGGGCVHIIDESIRLDLIALNDYFEKHHIVHVTMTTQVGRQFVAEIENQSLRALSVGGEKLVPVNPPKNFEFYNEYGPTECTIITARYMVDRLYDKVPVGKAIDNLKLYVVDQEGRRLPPGVPGELWVAGAQVGRGYLNRPEQTQKVFIQNPFSEEPGYERIYRTGDIVRIMPDGNLDFIGRNDGMVKIRGFRIELSEVERVIRQYPGIKDATVADFDAAGGGKFLAAYVVSDDVIDVEALNAFILDRKPPYMVPAVTMQIDRIPLTQNQKVNKKALPIPQKTVQDKIEPKNETQQKIFDCIAEVVGNSEFGITTDIYEAGVTSIGAIRLNVLLAKTFDVVIRNQDLKENNTIEKLEKFIAGADMAEAYEVCNDYPLTKTQSGIFIESVSNPGTTMYNIPSLFRIGSNVDVDKLKHAVELTIDAHSYLKTTLFYNEKGEVRAARNDTLPPVVETIVCDELPSNQELVRPYQLVGDRLYRIHIYQTKKETYLFLEVHHVICDGTSVGILLRDINLAYEGKMPEKESYSGYEIALDEEKLRNTDGYEKAKHYYDAIFEGVDSNFLLPKDSSASSEIPGEIRYDSEIPVSDVKAYCQKNDLTLNAFFNGVFAVVLSKYNYREEAVYTTIYHGRNDARLQNCVSMLVKTLPVYCNTEGNLKITDLLQTMKSHLMDNMANDLYSFEEISRSYHLSADVMFAYQGEEDFVFDTIAGEEAELCHLSLDTAKSPIAVELMIHEGKAVLTAEYRNDLYAKETILGILDCMVQVTKEFLCKTYIKDISMLSEEAREEMERFNDTDYPVEEVPVHRLFEKQVELHKDQIAVVAAGKKLTYQELNNRANRLAEDLVQKGLTIGESVGLILPRIVDVPAAEYGILKAGGAFLPMLPDYPNDRIEYCLQDSKSRFVVTTKAILEEKRDLFATEQYMVLTVEDYEDGAETENLSLDVPVDSLAYIIYTSGSTGKPKGVMIEHGNLCNFVDDNPKNHETAYLIHNGEMALAVASISFDYSLMEMHVPLCNGKSVCIATEEEIYNPPLLLQLMKENHVDAMLGTPSFISNFVDIVQDSDVLRQIRLYDVGAEAFPEKLYEKLHTLSPQAMIINGYGPTETTIGGIAKVMDGSGNVTIGTPAGNVRAYICDKCGKILPAGARGEMVICGLGVGRGYVNLPDRTAEMFITLEGRKAYRSGDLARYNKEGEIEFFGRLDNQVKLRGLRVELDEISNVMSTYPAVTNAIVLVKGEGQQQFLCGYYVAEKEIDHADFTEHMKKSLAPYMIPSVLIPLDVIPLTPNGKINKKALPEPERKAEEIVEPQNEMQKQIFECIAEVIGNRQFGITTDIYEAGLTSMGSIRLNVLLANTFDIVIRNQDLKEQDTIEKLETFILHAGKTENYEVYTDYPLSQTQSGIFVESVANPGTTIYNIPALLRLGSGVELETLKTAIEKTIDAHPYVKTTLFFNDAGDVRASRNDDAAPEVAIIRCKKLPSNEELICPYDLMGGRLYCVKIFETDEGNYLYMDFHHIICDGASVEIIIHDINRAYDGETLQTETYSGFEAALDEEKLRQTEAYDKAKNYYDSIFDGIDSNFLPPRDGNASADIPGVTRFVSEISVDKVKDYCQKHDVTLNAFFNGVFAVVLSKYNYRDEAVYTTIYNGRGDARLENSVSMLVKTLPVYCKTEGSLKITDMLTTVKKHLFDNMANDLYSFGEISRAYHLPADILFAYQGESSASNLIAGEPAQECEIQLNAVKAPLSIDVLIYDGKLTIMAEYQNDRYARETVDHMLVCMNKVTEEFLCKTYINEISMMSTDALEQMEQFNDTAYPVKEVLVHTLFEKQAELHGDEIACIADGRRLSYRELNHKANRLAELLLQGGLMVGEAVGMILPRIVMVPVAEYGILKAGGAFLPMLPDYPDDRIAFCLKDSKSRFVVTTKDIKEAKKDLFEQGNYQVLTVEEFDTDTEADNPNRDIPVDSLAYMIYTSGSTGTPKGVMIEHRNLCNFVDANPKNDETVHFVSYGKTALSVAAISFDFSLMEIHIPLCNGMAVCMANEEEIYNPLSLMRLIQDNQVDVISGTPSFISNFVDIPLAKEVLRQVKMYDFGAEAFPETLYEKLHQLSPNAVIVNGYGPTEATISCISKVMDGSGKVTIGTPAANVQAYICDLCGNILPAGAKGELVICGAGVGRGYVNLPEKTKEVFITLDGKKAYRSGDLARYNEEGEIEFFGRLDNQVKLRGLRVELDEISSVMNTYPSITHAIVLVKGEGQQQFLCGYYVAETTIDKTELTEHMKKSLAPYMIPSVLMQLVTMPLTANGKINKKALPEPDTSSVERDYVAPVTELQKRLAAMFAQALGMEKVGIKEDFFALGGTSLMASKVAMKAMLENIPIAYADIFDHPTVEKLEQFVLDKEGTVAETKETMAAEAVSEETGVNGLLSHNANQYVDEVSYHELGDVLLTGATGFLGIHVLKSLMTQTKHTVYCLIRKGKSPSVEVRLKSMLVYYFSDSMEELFGKRIRVIEGDITDTECVKNLKQYQFETVINCAACVKHFVNDDILDRINVQGVKNLVKFCSATGRRLVQISTVSIAGDNVNGKFPEEKTLHENELFFGQSLENKYIYTKFLAEQAVLEAVANGALDGKVIRVGNLMSRHSDGEFQINFVTNGFMRMLRGYAAIGKYPVSLMDATEEFSPIDCTADAIVRLSGVNSKFTVFHACNSHRVQMGDVIEVMNHCGLKVEVVSEEEFAEALKEALADEQTNMFVSGLISYLSSDSQNTVKYIDYDNVFTIKTLYRLGYKWPITDDKYLANAFIALKTLGFFDVQAQDGRGENNGINSK